MDEDITPNGQDQHPNVGTKVPDEDLGPKVDSPLDEDGNGAVVGTPGSAAGATADMQEQVGKLIDGDGSGYLGHNPDPNPNDAYTLPGVIANGGASPGGGEMKPAAQEPTEADAEAAE